MNEELTEESQPFGLSLYADVEDMDEFVRSTIRSASSFIDVRRHRMGVAA